MQVGEIKRVLIVGAGTMGQQIGLLCAVNGLDTVIHDLSGDALEKARDRIRRLADKFVAHQRVSEKEAAVALENIRMTEDKEEAAREADFLSESVPENVELKCRIFEEFNRLCPARTIFTTNTSSLIPSMMAADTGRPEKFAAFHFHNTLTTSIVDVMPHPATSLETIALIEAFARRLGQTPILLQKENHGYVFNAMLMNLCDTALYLAAGGVADIEDIDRSWMGVMGMRVGPFGIMDSIGLDTVLSVNEIWASQLNDPKAIANVAFLKQYVEAGKLGTKTGQGFYVYPGPSFLEDNFVNRS
ncbi:MAG: 3-hydroxyacyl-CoA dehydrogenase [Desulfosudaceae bacterium]